MKKSFTMRTPYPLGLWRILKPGMIYCASSLALFSRVQAVQRRLDLAHLPAAPEVVIISTFKDFGERLGLEHKIEISPPTFTATAGKEVAGLDLSKSCRPAFEAAAFSEPSAQLSPTVVVEVLNPCESDLFYKDIESLHSFIQVLCLSGGGALGGRVPLWVLRV